MKAMVLAAGEGTRLRPLTLTLPKPMIPIVGVPLLERTLRWLAEQGVDEAAINLFHRPQVIPDFFGPEFAGIKLHYFFEETLRGTAGGVKAASPIFQDSPFFVIYGDNLVQADLKALARYHENSGATATLGLFHHPNPSAAGLVDVNSEGRITRFVEKPPAAEVFTTLANAGVYVLDPAVLDSIPADTPSDFGREIFPRLLASEQPLYGFPLGGYLQDTGTPETYRQANWDTLGTETLWLGRDARIGAGAALSGRNIVGRGASVGGGASLTDCILWDGAQIAPGVALERVIVARNVVVTSTPIAPGALLAGEEI